MCPRCVDTRMDTAGGLGGGTTTMAPSKGKGKVAQVSASNNEVSSDDDALLQRRLRSIRSTGSMVGGPTPVEPWVPEVTLIGGSSRSNPAAVDTVMVEMAAVDKDTVDAAVAKKATYDVMAVAVKATADKEVMDVAATKKATNDIKVVEAAKVAENKEATDATVAKKATDDATLMKGGAGGGHRGIGRSWHHTNTSGGGQEVCCAEPFLSVYQMAIPGLLEGSVCQASLNLVALLI
jgi:hypothetical protein